MSLDATSADIAIVVTMAAAFFAGTFNSTTKLASVNPELSSPVAQDLWAGYGVIALSAYTMLSLLLSGRMVIRLRIAVADHSNRLATVRCGAQILIRDDTVLTSRATVLAEGGPITTNARYSVSCLW